MDNIDVNFTNLPHHPHRNRHQVLQKYITALRQLRTLAEQNYSVRPFYFDNYVLWQYFQQRSSTISETEAAKLFYVPSFAMLNMQMWKHILDRRRQILYWLSYLLLAFCCIFAYRHESSTLMAQRSVQYFVYPGMRMWRRLTLPLIERFPRLTELYDESCLMENPFFEVEDLSCEPCAHVDSVLQLSYTDNVVPNNDENRNNVDGEVIQENTHITSSEFTPSIFQINQNPIQLNDFYNIYASNREIFQRDAYRVQSTNHYVTNLEELFNQFNNTQQSSQKAHGRQSQVHNLWRCNRMLPARLLRKVFSRPARLPSTGIALERYMAIDSSQASAYNLPDTECSNVFIHQALGTRFIILRPTSACRHICRTLSLRLPQSFVLSYNWWYWKPISAPDPASDKLSISLIGSYC